MNPARKLSALLLVAALGAALAARAAEVIVRVAPPPPVSTAVIGVAPGPGYVWVPGYQRWNGSRYVWVAGRWTLPPRRGLVWVPPHTGFPDPEATSLCRDTGGSGAEVAAHRCASQAGYRGEG
jgi:hypothetical protein